ncbi:MAG: hypothetical protein WAS05_00695, partial [Candidatus Nanopelagicales bacterium]
RSQPMTSDLPNLQDIKARIETCDCPDVPVLVAALEAVIEDCQKEASYGYGPFGVASGQQSERDKEHTLALIAEHLGIGDTE